MCHQLPVDSNLDPLHIDVDTRLLDSFINHMLEPGAAGHDHRGHRQRKYGVVFEDLSKLLDVGCCIIQLGAGNNQFFPFQEILVEASKGEGGAIGSNQKIALVEIRSKGGYQVELYGPLAQF